ncbi:unnamed protein product [Dovyalis caffra]|uniref:Uncharacterized protein n=1 Tax=Dovyalis caffra TaxID=77055 RepID=A0AAV1RGX9_9ROSI|nr:unnamed protein product [Dovyalis caffra]
MIYLSGRNRENDSAFEGFDQSAAQSKWRAVLSQFGHNRPFASSTTPKFATMSHNAAHHVPYNRYAITGEFGPIYVLAGMLSVAVAMGCHTMKQQLVHSPGVSINKKRRESIAEVDEPDMVVADANKFLGKSFLRKVAHVQEHTQTLPDPSRANPFTKPQDAETLKTVGVNPRHH